MGYKRHAVQGRIGNVRPAGRLTSYANVVRLVAMRLKHGKETRGLLRLPGSMHEKSREIAWHGNVLKSHTKICSAGDGPVGISLHGRGRSSNLSDP